MNESYDLTKLEPNSFEHLINHLALCVLGNGHTGFGPGADGGRDGFFEGEAPYPSEENKWSGIWYIQSKFHKPHLSKNPQKWLIERIKDEIKAFNDSENDRAWPDNWIVATNIEPSGVLMTGAFDKARNLVAEACPKLKNNFHIWGGSKILQLLALYPKISEYYCHFLTPGNVLASIFNQVKDSHAEIQTIFRFLIVKQFKEQIYTKLDQAGSEMDTRPGIQHLFMDLPFRAAEFDLNGFAVESLVKASSRCQRIEIDQPDSKDWRRWYRHPSRARVWFIKGGPGQGKSTIGQYYSQIQRAALILEKQKIEVLSQDRRIAEEIKEVAERDGFWPKEPRIPIFIELKDFAHWFGQRSKLNDPCGIITYLAERISVGVEQSVLPGTLKRILGSRSWFVLFDGLDEVPNDVKNDVAGEVLNFINDICLECKSDLLALCTSRPQGYAGHFSKLDAPTVELVNLSPEQALTCAKPVLTFGRTEGEVVKTLSILNSAIESESVQELMTTPLQAHIMAVVVRDGGRPPDRRWQLFSNFYQVIKRREANRDLPDKNLAKLLREDDQLLKGVHNSLGFVLQARAENSSGAQTHLSRSEFQELVANIVSKMIEIEIEKTVNILMEATTDRLVLVSTPDDGNHLRFDIRPLQEFFAAEFIYESIDAEKLQQRLELIAGDVHWREVMHFLLSALIENNRRTELSVAISVLEALNEGDDGNQTRLLQRRLGKGSLIAARLLQEGVLEQDKRLRQQFRKCIDPLTSSTELSELKPLILVSQTNSKSWLLNFLFDIVNEADRNESIGAAIILIFILPNTDDRLNEIERFFLTASHEFNSVVLETLPSFPYEKEEYPPIQSWFFIIILKLLMHDDFCFLSGEAIFSAISILRLDNDKTIKVAQNINFQSDEIGLLKELLFSNYDYKVDRNKSECGLDCGIVKSNYFEHDWTTGTYEYKYLSPDIDKEEKEYHGIFDSVFKVIKFSKNRKFENFIAMLSCLEKYDYKNLAALPDRLRAFIPTCGFLAPIDTTKKLISINKRQFDILLSDCCINKQQIPRPTTQLHIGNDCNITQWKQLLNFYPELALLFLSERFWPRGRNEAPVILKDKEAIELLIKKAIRHQWILSHHPNIWGKLIKYVPDRTDDLKVAMRQAASSKVSTKSYLRASFHPFKLILPEDAVLLPHILAALINRPFSQIKTEMLTSNIQKSFENISLLESVIAEPENSSNVRLSAIFFLILESFDQKIFRKYESEIIKFYYPGVEEFYFSAINACLYLLFQNNDTLSQDFIGKLFYAVRKDIRGKKALNKIIMRWREISHSPVQSSNVLQSWLVE